MNSIILHLFAAELGQNGRYRIAGGAMEALQYHERIHFK